MGGIRETRKRETRQAIIEAAVSLFSEKGFEKTSIEAIARMAGIGKGTIYGYFRAKEEIFLAFCEDEIDYAFGMLAEKNDPQAPLLEQLVILFMSQFRFVTRNREFGRLLAREIAFPREVNREKSRDMDARYLQGLGMLLSGARQRGELKPSVDNLLATGHLYAIYLLMLSCWYSGYLVEEQEVEASLRALLHQALSGLGERVSGDGGDPGVIEKISRRIIAQSSTESGKRDETHE
ncbi:TetR/AcrR family transcriptional regulator [Trichloromonas sp.]|uniref:TetR/AcrR family transcriptional regulator n=1 Tax=Trichloromonas sp. TaxID=3069249 RepID=UPI003D816768